MKILDPFPEFKAMADIPELQNINSIINVIYSVRGTVKDIEKLKFYLYFYEKYGNPIWNDSDKMSCKDFYNTCLFEFDLMKDRGGGDYFYFRKVLGI